MNKKTADLLDGKFFDGAVDNLADLVLKSVQLHREDVLQCKCLGVHVERLSRLFHQLLPVTGHNTTVLSRDAFVTTNRRAIAMMFVRLSLCPSVRLGQACIMIIPCMLART